MLHYPVIIKFVQLVCAAALMSLKRKKAYEKQIEQIDNSIARVNEQQMMLENQRTTAETVLALQQGVRANKATMQASSSLSPSQRLLMRICSICNVCCHYKECTWHLST